MTRVRALHVEAGEQTCFLLSRSFSRIAEEMALSRKDNSEGTAETPTLCSAPFPPGGVTGFTPVWTVTSTHSGHSPWQGVDTHHVTVCRCEMSFP